MIKLWLATLFVLALPSVACSDDALSNPDQEARAAFLGSELRCVVCQSQSINDSEADMARDMRLLVRAKVADGWDDQQILSFMQARYGDFILLKPPIQGNTYLLWGLPLLFIAAGAALTRSVIRRKTPVHKLF